jgi:hypothetical protein
VPAASKIFLMEPDTGEVIRSIPGPVRHSAHMGWPGIKVCCGASTRTIVPSTAGPEGRESRVQIQLSKEDPAPHGLDIDAKGVLWYCDAGTSWICKLA